MSIRVGTAAKASRQPTPVELPELLLRLGIALAAALLTAIVPWVAVVLLVLLAMVYAAAAGLFLVTARGGNDGARIWRDDMNDLQGGAIGRIWPAAAALVFFAVLTA